NVTLKFAEPTRFGVGQRVFNVVINGTPVLSNFDIYAQAGGAFIALDKSFPVSASGGTITVQFTSVLGDLPMVNGIAIQPGSGAPPSSSATVRVRSGGGSYTDVAGRVWAADNSYSDGAPWSTSAFISNTSTPVVYQTCRYGNFSYTFAVPNGSYAVT